MPQNIIYDNIFVNQKYIMSTILIQRQPEPLETLVKSIPVKKGETLQTTQSPKFNWEDLAGLSWILLDKGDEF
ncbi:MAG: hypothetical protein COY74_07665 [Nitrosopumilales archaeon CG_4_10_14_0_8_um_filter_34_8]|jgi:hypothetical protein|nr:MAG: hypothetical protein COY74_07665 [Nitrosopumilales archaeon CG_4_10_14_0_8_um_filter_34_8]